ncbi:protein NinF [Escherichia coli]
MSDPNSSMYEEEEDE